MKKLLNLLTFCGILGGQVTAQNATEAMYYSQNFFQADARSLAMGGASGVLASPLAGSINPAGIGFYEYSEFSFSGSMTYIDTRSLYIGESHKDLAYNFNLPNLGLMLHLDRGEGTYVLGITVNRTANFNRRRFFQGINTENSITEFLAEDANGTLPEDLSVSSYGGNAYESYLIDPFVLDPEMYIPVIDYEYETRVLQSEMKESRGSANDVNISLAYRKEKVSVGGTIGWATIRYYETVEFFEENQANSVIYYRSMSLMENISTIGDGIFASLGVVVDGNLLRGGISLKSPTVYDMLDSYERDMRGQFRGYTDEGFYFRSKFVYKLITPPRLNLSLALIRPVGVISLDCELLDYRMASLSSPEFRFSKENRKIDNEGMQALNLRVGFSSKIMERFFLRGGYNRQGKVTRGSRANSSFSGGIGIALKSCWIDLAYVYRKEESSYIPYILSYEETPESREETTRHIITLTCSFPF